MTIFIEKLFELNRFENQKLSIFCQSGDRSTMNQPVCKKIQNYIFKFTDMLGKGNFSKVYKAHHQITNDTVAIKIIELNSLKSQKLEQLLFSEIDVLKKLNHPNILRCFEVFTSNRNCYIITEICNGGDLQTKLRREHHFSQLSAQPIIKDIFCGLLYLAQKNVIHRDLKVANVFLHNGRAKIADFGFAKFTNQNFKDINIGSPIYMSPQGLINNVYGPKTDIWAFGVLIYQLLHGQTPYAHCRTQAQLKYHVAIPVSQKKMRQQLSSQIKQIICKCMQTDQTRRVTAFDLQKLPYFQRLMDKSPLRRMDSPVIQKKYSTTSQKYVGPSSAANIANQQAIQRHNFLMPKQQQGLINLPSSKTPLQKKSSSPISYPHQRVDTRYIPHQRRGVSIEKRTYDIKQRNDSYDHRQQRQIQSPVPQKNFGIPINLPNGSKVFSAQFTFKQCVNLLHYCRLVYKYTHPSQQNQIKILSGWVLFLMDQIKSKINQGAVIYEGDNSLMREKKLRQVTNQYTKKYSQQLGQYPYSSDLNLNLLLTYVKSYYEKVDGQITMGKDHSWLALGHYIVMIVDCTFLLKKCQQQRSYRPFSSYKELEAFLNKNKDTMDLHSYKLLRQKISFIKNKYN